MADQQTLPYWKTGVKQDPRYGVWIGLRRRVGHIRGNTPQAAQDYAERGIDADPRWLDSFRTFCADVGPRPSPKHSLDRRDNARGYWPDNVRWVTWAEQMRNTRKNVQVLVDGVPHVLSDAARLLGISQQTLSYRHRHGLPLDVHNTKERPIRLTFPDGSSTDYPEQRQAEAALGVGRNTIGRALNAGRTHVKGVKCERI